MVESGHQALRPHKMARLLCSAFLAWLWSVSWSLAGLLLKASIIYFPPHEGIETLAPCQLEGQLLPLQDECAEADSEALTIFASGRPALVLSFGFWKLGDLELVEHD